MKGLSFIGRHFLAAAALTVATAAHPEEKIGLAVIIRNDVNGVLSSRTMPINAGEEVFGKEIVKTGQESSAKLVFADSTNLAVGPNSAVTLDKFVYAGPTDYKKATLTLARGAFRFTTGNSDKRAYEIKTGVATIGVRGTVGDILSLSNKTIVTVRHGVMLACSLVSYQCTVVHAGETAVITPRSAINQGNNGPVQWSFERHCGEGICEVTQYASLNEPPAEAFPRDYTPFVVGAGAAGAIGGGIAAGASTGGGASSVPFFQPTAPVSP
jgi:hypothetical protein